MSKDTTNKEKVIERMAQAIMSGELKLDDAGYARAGNIVAQSKVALKAVKLNDSRKQR